MKRLAAGEYQSADGRVVVRRHVSRQTYRADETSWSVTIDGKYLQDVGTKSDAVAYAESYLRRFPHSSGVSS